ncbi:FAD-dependent oxidoreductase, partial [Staphylococcus aureus]|uniref:FAD-dependent oxidoreductase n=1 Tax=Staphylococcus aureus TaxID=1280 RepID=UPI002181F071
LQKKMTVEDTIMNPYDWYEDNNIQLIVNDPVESVDRANKIVTTSNGIDVDYDICIFATGSSAFVLPIPGSDLPSVIGWRTIEDTERMIEIAKTKKRAVVIGGGLLNQFDITVIGKEPYPNYNRIMLSNILQKKMTVEDTIMNPYDWYEDNNIQLIVNDPVE